MLPVFTEYRKMLKDFGVDLSNYDEDKLWVDRLIIRGICKDGEVKKICRLKVTDELEYEYKFYATIPKNEELETWEETYERMKKEIFEREIESKDIIEQSLVKYPSCSLFVSTSMGKDSKLVEFLVNQITKDYKLLFNNTTCDSPEVYKEVKERKEIIIVNAKDKNGKNKSLYNMAKRYGFATRSHRWCCSHFKENNIKDFLKGEKNIIQYLGMRNEESTTRANYEFEKIDNRFDPTWHFFLPIRKWTELELWLYTIHNNIPINQKYKMGYSRVGCAIVCPFYTKSTWILDKYWYPIQFKRFHNMLDEDFKTREGWCWKNCTQKEYHTNWNGGLVRKEPTKEVIEEFCDYKGFDNIKLAEQYFSKDCVDCGKAVWKKDEIAMNLKLMGRGINKFKCKKCLMRDNNWTKDEWDKQVNKFKESGCTLF